MLLLRCSGIASTCHRSSLGTGRLTRSFHSSHAPKLPNVSSSDGNSGSNASKSASIGPFPLGRQPPPPVTGRMKNWKELSTPEKVARSGEQSFNFGIIIVGTVVFVILPTLDRQSWLKVLGSSCLCLDCDCTYAGQRNGYFQ